MTLDDYDDFSKVVMGFAELKGKKLSPPAIKLYFRALQHWSLEEFKLAAEHLLRTCEFMPTPKNFEDLRKASQMSIAEAWEQAQTFARSLWHPMGYRNGSIGNRAIDLAAGAVGGYPAIAMADVEKLQWLEKQFAAAYETTSDVETVREALPSVAQAHDSLLADLRSRPQGFAQVSAVLAKPEVRSMPPIALPAPKPEPKPTKSPREKVLALAGLHADFSAEDIARIAGESVEVVREILAQREHAA